MGRRAVFCLAWVCLLAPLAIAERIVVGWNPRPGPAAPAQTQNTIGFVADVVSEAAKREGFEIEWRETHNALEVDQALDSGRIDLYPAAISTASRRARYYITSPWWSEDLAFVVRLDGPQTEAALVGKRIALNTGMLEETARRVFARSIILRPDSRHAGTSLAAAQLCRGEADAALMSHRDADMTVGFNRPPECEGTLISTLDSAATMGIALMARPAQAPLARRLRDRIDELTADGSLAAIAARHPGIPASSASEMAEKMRERGWRRAMSIALGGFALLSIAGAAFTWRIRRMAGALRQSEARYRLLFESMQELFAHCEVISDSSGRPVDWRFIEANPRFEEMTGAHGKLKGRTYREAFPGRASAELIERLGEVGLTGKPARFETFGTVTQRHYMVAASSPRHGQFSVVFTDLTEQRHAHQQLQTVLNSIQGGLVLLDKDWRYTYFSEQGAALLGLRVEDMLGRVVWDLFPNARGTKFYEGFHRAVRTGEPVKFEEYYAEPFNRWLECHCYPSPDGLSVYFHDVTERRRAEQAVRDSEARFQALVEYASDAFFLHDSEGRIVEVNRQACNSVGYTRYELLERRIYEIESGFEDAKSDAGWPRLGIDATATVRGRHRRKDGTLFPVEARVSACTIKGQRLYLCLIRDVTEHENAAERLRMSNEELQAYAYTVSHDLQEPIRTVALYTDLLGRRFGAALGSEGRELLDVAQGSALRMITMLQDLLRYSRAGQETEQHTLVDATEAARQAANVLQARLSEAGGEVIVGALPTVRASPGRLEQVFQNLIENAVKYRRPAVAPRIQIEAAASSGMVQFSVTDNGIGMEAGYADRIFRVFQRLHGREEYSGNGIGLSIVKRIVERHGGRVWVDWSAPGEGSRFCFTLPAAESAATV